jgi:hypothetical protein
VDCNSYVIVREDEEPYVMPLHPSVANVIVSAERYDALCRIEERWEVAVLLVPGLSAIVEEAENGRAA